MNLNETDPIQEMTTQYVTDFSTKYSEEGTTEERATKVETHCGSASIPTRVNASPVRPSTGLLYSGQPRALIKMNMFEIEKKIKVLKENSRA